MSLQKIGLIACWTLGFALAAPAGADEEMLFSADEPLTAGQLTDAVLRRNPGLAELRAVVEEAESRIEPAGSLDDPMLSLNAAPNTFGSELGSRGQLQFSQALPWWGTLDAREAAARAGADAAEQDVETLRLRLRAAAQAAFADWRFVHQALTINKNHQDLLAELREVARARYAAGRAPQQDVLQADVERALLRQQALELARQQTTIRARINALLNRPAQAFLPLPGELPLATDLPPLARLEAFALDRHPTLRQLEFRQRAASARVTVAEKARYPEFRVMAGYNGVMDPVEKRALIGISINVPLDQSKRDAEISGARARERGLGYALEDMRARLAGDLAAAYAAVEETHDSLALYRDELVPLAESTLAVSRSDYAGGKGDFLNVIAAERHRLNTQLGLVHAEALLFQRLGELGRLAGIAYPFELAPPAQLSEFEELPHD